MVADCEKRLLWLRTAKSELDRACGDRAVAAERVSTATSRRAQEADAKLAAAVALAKDLRAAIDDADLDAFGPGEETLRSLPWSDRSQISQPA